MNILIISLDKGLLGRGQLGDVIERHREYGRRVDSIDIIVFSKIGFEKFKISENVTAYPTNSSTKFLYPMHALKLAKNLYKAKPYDLVVTQDPFLAGWIGLKLKKKFGSKLLVHLHGDFIDNPYWLKEDWKNHFLIIFGKRLILLADGVRVMSAAQKEKLVKMGISEKKIQVISTPVNIEKFSLHDNEEVFNALQARVAALGRKRMVLMVGRKDPVKDFSTLFEAMKIVFEKKGDVGLWLVGNYKESELDLIPLPKDRLLVSDNIESVNLPAYYKISEMTVLSSTSESFGKVLVEANACGRPIVATDTTGAKEIIQDGYNGFLVPIGNPQALAEKILWLLNNPEKAVEMGENGRKLVFEKYDGKKNIQKIIRLWQDISGMAPKLEFSRMEIKYLLPINIIDSIMKEVKKNMELDEYSKRAVDSFYGISNLYYDTPDFNIYRDRIHKGVEHVKYRLRTYEDAIASQTRVYPEIKRRMGILVNKVRSQSTYSQFIESMKANQALFSDMKDDNVIIEFLENVSKRKLEPKVIVVYKRLAFVSHNEDLLRVTLDKDFQAKKFQDMFDAKFATKILDGFSIMEIKYNHKVPMWLKDIIQKYALKEFLGSKYCLAIERCFHLNK